MATKNINALNKLLESLKTKYNENKDVIYNYVVPELWNIHNYNDKDVINTSNGDILVNPYNSLISLIENDILPQRNARVNYSK